MLGHIAIPYYEKVLEMEPVGSTEDEKRVSAKWQLLLSLILLCYFLVVHHHLFQL